MISKKGRTRWWRCSVRAGARARGCFVPEKKGDREGTARTLPGPDLRRPLARHVREVDAFALERAPRTEGARLSVSPEPWRRGRAGGGAPGALGPVPPLRSPPRRLPGNGAGRTGRAHQSARGKMAAAGSAAGLGGGRAGGLGPGPAPQPAPSCTERGGSSQLDPGFSQQGTPLLIVEDSQPQDAEADAERAWLGVLARRLPARRSPSPVLVSARRGGSTTRPCPARPGPHGSDAAPPPSLAGHRPRSCWQPGAAGATRR